jgi:hypothetical protein
MPAAHVELRLYAAGVAPQTDKPYEVQSPEGTQTLHYGPVTAAPDVDGTSASWVGVPGNPEMIILKWRYAPDGWAELFTSRLSGDQRQAAHRIASALNVGGAERLRFPFQLAGLPADLAPVASTVEEGGLSGPWRASLDVKGQGPTVSVAVQPATADRDPNTTIDGHPARRDTFEGDHLGRPEYSDRLSVYDLDGLEAHLAIAATTAAEAASAGPDGVLGVYRVLTVQPDRAKWTDQPLR